MKKARARQVPNTATCSVRGCRNCAARGGKCWTHLKRAKRGTPLEREVRGYRMSKRERLSKAVAIYSAAETEENFEKADALLKKYSTVGGRKRVAAIVRETVREMLRQFARAHGLDVDNGQKEKMSTS